MAHIGDVQHVKFILEEIYSFLLCNHDLVVIQDHEDNDSFMFNSNLNRLFFSKHSKV